MAEPQRPGKEWKQWDQVCPRRLANQGRFVVGAIVQAHEIGGYTPPGSYEYQTHLYIVEWQAPIRHAPQAREHGVFLGNDLLTLEAGAKEALRVIEEQKTLAFDGLGLNEAERVARRFLEDTVKPRP
ncbi:MAG: hypothetical protein QY323_05185 [Patescibacteria group bacterium]|nr:MAG: hypothetical protein QY323_05185 [Patescibacteria group bacterium]